MQKIIDSNSVSPAQILTNAMRFVKSQSPFDKATIDYNQSALNLAMQVMAGYSTYNLYKFNQMRNETYLQYAKKDESVWEIARQLGYNICRAISPKISLLYKGAKTIPLKSGDILGKANGVNIVFFGNSKIVENGDIVECVIGNYHTIQKAIIDLSDEIVADLMPQELSAIDNSLITLRIDGVKYDISKDAESYIVLNEAVDFSLNAKSTRIYLRNAQRGYGIESLSVGSVYDLEYIETNGYDSSLSLDSIIPISDFYANEILSQGANYESKENIASNASFYYSTMRRAVLEKEYTYLLKNHAFMRDVYAVVEQGTKGVWQLPIQTSQTITKDNVYSISLKADTKYSAVAKDSDTIESIINNLVAQIDKGGFAKVDYDKQSNNLQITNASDRIALSPIGSTNLFSTTQELVTQIPAPCCTIDVFYIKHNQTRTGEILTLSETEQLEYAKFSQNFKLAGQTLIFAPAQRLFKQIRLQITLSDLYLTNDSGEIVTQTIKDKINSLLESSFEFKLGVSFNYSEMLASITKIGITKDNEAILPIVAIIPSQDSFNVECKPNEYLIFDSVEIDFVAQG